MRLTCLSSVLAAAFVSILPVAASAQAPMSYALESTTGLQLHNVAAEPATLHGKKGLRLTLAPAAAPAQPDLEQLAVLDGVEFSNGVIEAEVAGEPASGAGQGARGIGGHGRFEGAPIVSSSD